MKCICLRKCFVSFNGRNTRFNQGDVAEFDKCPTHFDELGGGAAVDFKTSGKQELMASEFELKDMKEFILSKYDKKTGNTGKEKTIDILLDCRDREITINLDKL